MIVPVVFLAGAVLFGATESAGTGREITVMFWNMENFFDFKDDGTGESDAEFSATGPRRWSKARFYRKCHAVAKTILWAGSGTVRSGDNIAYTSLPDIVGMAEVENRFVLTQLVTKTALRKLDYKIVHFDSPDPRGIDCALLYRASRLTMVSAKPCRVSAPGLQTRDILLTQFITACGDSLAVLVNHHPSKYGGGETDWRREVAVARLRALGDSLAASGWPLAVAVGDFNDTPDNPLFTRLAPAFSLCRMTEPAKAHENRMERLSSEGDAASSRLLMPLAGGADPFRVNARPAASPSEDSLSRRFSCAVAGSVILQREKAGARREKMGLSGVSLKSPTAMARGQPEVARESPKARKRATATSRRQFVSPPPYLDG